MADFDDEFLRFQAELASVEVAAEEAPAAAAPSTHAAVPEPVVQRQQPLAAPAPAQHMAAGAGQHLPPPTSRPPTAGMALPPPTSRPPTAAMALPPPTSRPPTAMIPPPPFNAYGMPPPPFYAPNMPPPNMPPPPLMRPPQMGFNPYPQAAAQMLPPPTLVPVPFTLAHQGGGPPAPFGMVQRQPEGTSHAQGSGSSAPAFAPPPSPPPASVPVPPPAAAAAAPHHAPPAAPVVPLTEEQKERQAKIEAKKAKGVLREAAGKKWRDPTLVEWPENDFRIFVGDLGTEVSDELLARAFKQYGSFAKAKIVRDKRTNKSKGFGFVSFLDSADFAKALREMNGKYVGNRPCKLTKSSWDDRAGTFKRKDGSVGGGPSQGQNKKHKH